MGGHQSTAIERSEFLKQLILHNEIELNRQLTCHLASRRYHDKLVEEVNSQHNSETGFDYYPLLDIIQEESNRLRKERDQLKVLAEKLGFSTS